MWAVPRVIAAPRTDLWLGMWWMNLIRTLLRKTTNVCSLPYSSASLVLFHATPSGMSLFKRQPRQKGMKPCIKKHVVAGGLSWEADSEMETDVLDAYWVVILGITFLRGEGGRTEQRKNSNFSVTATETSAICQGSLQWFPTQSWAFVSLNEP